MLFILFLFLYVCLLAVFGFFLAIVTGVVAKEEITVKSGMLMTFIAGIVSGVVGSVLEAGEVAGLIPALVPPAVFFGLLTLLLMTMGAVPGGKAAMVSGIFSVVYLVVTGAIYLSLQVPDSRQSAAPEPRPMLIGRSIGA